MQFLLVFLILFVFSWLTDILGFSAIFGTGFINDCLVKVTLLTLLLGAFEVGCIVPRKSRLIPELSQKLEDLVIVVFMPLFFTFSTYCFITVIIRSKTIIDSY